MAIRTVGIEEELLLIDPETRAGSPRAPEVLKWVAERRGDEAAELDHELFRDQLETRTPPLQDLEELRHVLVERRTRAAEAAQSAGLAIVASGTLPLAISEPRLTRDDRYLAMLDRYGEIARPGGTCGMHVHVAIDSPEQGVRVIDEIAPWLPVVLAASANSPYTDGRDTRHASWRSRIWSMWPSAGPTEQFGSVQGYREASDRLIASGAARDEGMLYFDARLSRNFPTVEVRISDVCTDPDDAVLVAALVRGLVSLFARRWADGAKPGPSWRAEMLRAAQWRAARFGLTDRILHPGSMELAPAREVLEGLVDLVADDLDLAGDLDRVRDGLPRVLADGGATRQRAAFERSNGSIEAVVDDLIRRSGLAGPSAR